VPRIAEDYGRDSTPKIFLAAPDMHA
jgi:hypothetical protein